MADMVEVYSHRVRIRDLRHADRIMGCMSEAREHWKNRIVFGPDMETPEPHSFCRFYSNLTHEILSHCVERRKPKFSGTSTTGIPYRIHEVPRWERPLIGSILGESCQRYYRIYMQTDDGLVIHNCGEHRKWGRATEILNLPELPASASGVAD